jgi:hypothetical protein
VRRDRHEPKGAEGRRGNAGPNARHLSDFGVMSMAIAKKPQSHQLEVESFIARGGGRPSRERRQETCRDYPLPARAFKARRPRC